MQESVWCGAQQFCTSTAALPRRHVCSPSPFPLHIRVLSHTLSRALITFLSLIWCQSLPLLVRITGSIKDKSSLWGWKVKPMDKCLKPAWFLTASRGWILWLQKNQIKSNKIGVLKSLWESSQQLCYVYKIKASIEFKKKIIQGILMLLSQWACWALKVTSCSLHAVLKHQEANS